jgi:hypothetical protein
MPRRIPSCLPVLLLFLASVVRAQDSSQPPHCVLKQHGTVDLLIANEILVPVTIDGHAGHLVLNVGDGGTVLWDTFVKEARLHRNYSYGRGVEFQSHVVRSTARFREFRLGSLSFGKGQFMVTPPVWTAPSAPPGARVIGALGMDVFSRVDFELDFANRKLNVFAQHRCSGNPVYWTEEYAALPLQRDSMGNAFVTMEVEQKKLQAMLVMGHELSVLTADAARRLFGVRRLPESDEPYVAMGVTAPGLKAANVRVRLRRAETECALRTSGVARYVNCEGVYPLEVGRNLLKALRLYFAMKEQVLYVSAADASK